MTYAAVVLLKAQSPSLPLLEEVLAAVKVLALVSSHLWLVALPRLEVLVECQHKVCRGKHREAHLTHCAAATMSVFFLG